MFQVVDSALRGSSLAQWKMGDYSDKDMSEDENVGSPDIAAIAMAENDGDDMSEDDDNVSYGPDEDDSENEVDRVSSEQIKVTSKVVEPTSVMSKKSGKDKRIPPQQNMETTPQRNRANLVKMAKTGKLGLPPLAIKKKAPSKKTQATLPIMSASTGRDSSGKQPEVALQQPPPELPVASSLSVTPMLPEQPKGGKLGIPDPGSTITIKEIVLYGSTVEERRGSELLSARPITYSDIEVIFVRPLIDQCSITTVFVQITSDRPIVGVEKGDYICVTVNEFLSDGNWKRATEVPLLKELQAYYEFETSKYGLARQRRRSPDSVVTLVDLCLREPYSTHNRGVKAMLKKVGLFEKQKQIVIISTNLHQFLKSNDSDFVIGLLDTYAKKARQMKKKEISTKRKQDAVDSVTVEPKQPVNKKETPVTAKLSNPKTLSATPSPSKRARKDTGKASFSSENSTNQNGVGSIVGIASDKKEEPISSSEYRKTENDFTGSLAGPPDPMTESATRQEHPINLSMTFNFTSPTAMMKVWPQIMQIIAANEDDL